MNVIDPPKSMVVEEQGFMAVDENLLSEERIRASSTKNIANHIVSFQQY